MAQLTAKPRWTVYFVKIVFLCICWYHLYGE